MARNYGLSDLKFLKPTTLYSWMKGGAPGAFAVVDVRDSDYVGGHIKGCYHYPSGNFSENLPELRKRLKDEQVQDVIFHCALSQVRGPSSTLKFLRSLNEAKDPEEAEFFSQIGVWVLQGGFNKWQHLYGKDSSVTEGYEADLWE